MEAMIAGTAAGSLSIRACLLEDIQSVLELWRLADATPGKNPTRKADESRVFRFWKSAETTQTK
jgi:hypothetical protein